MCHSHNCTLASEAWTAIDGHCCWKYSWQRGSENRSRDSQKTQHPKSDLSTFIAPQISNTIISYILLGNQSSHLLGSRWRILKSTWALPSTLRPSWISISAPSHLRSLPHVASETVPVLVWLTVTMVLSHSFKVGRWPLGCLVYASPPGAVCMSTPIAQNAYSS